MGLVVFGALREFIQHARKDGDREEGVIGFLNEFAIMSPPSARWHPVNKEEARTRGSGGQRGWSVFHTWRQRSHLPCYNKVSDLTTDKHGQSKVRRHGHQHRSQIL